MSDIEQQQSDHLIQNLLPPSISRVRKPDSEILPTASSSQFDDGQDVSREVAPSRGAVQVTLQDPHPTDIAIHGMEEYSPPPCYTTVPAVSYMYPPADVGFVEGIPEHQQVIFPVHQGNHQLGNALRCEIPCLTQAAVSYPLDHDIPLGPPTAENLRRLANYYMHCVDSQVEAVCIERMERMERTSPGRCKVTIALEVTDFL